MRIVVAPQALKGSLDAVAVAGAIHDGIRRVVPDAEVRLIPVADGGEGTVRALVTASAGRYRTVEVHDPLGRPIHATFGILGTEGAGSAPVAVIEMAAASGLPLLAAQERDPRHTSTFGTGELIRAALDAGCEHIVIGIGGSATNDGGAGMAQALGARFLDEHGAPLAPGGAALARLARIDISQLDPRIHTTRMQIACDVTNVLCGPAGASAVYGPQKGATPEMVRELDDALAHYAQILRRDLGADVAEIPGSGAAGGLGAGLLAFTHAELIPGAKLVLDTVGFDEAARSSDLVITAEGWLDRQTAYGKAVGTVATRARAAGAHVIALAGGIDASSEELAALGIDAAIPLPDRPLALDESMARATELVTRATERAFRLLRVGADIFTPRQP